MESGPVCTIIITRFSRTDTVTDSERFYNSILDLFKDVEENEEVNDLLLWWNRYALASDQV